MSTSLAEINVVPLVDVMLVLLVIFMVTAPMMQQGLKVNLPQARRGDPVNAQPIYVTIPADFAQRRFVQIGEEQVRFEVLSERVRQAILPREDKSLFVRMDAAVTAQDIYSVFDELKRAGVEKVAARPRRPKEGRLAMQEAVSAILHRARAARGRHQPHAAAVDRRAHPHRRRGLADACRAGGRATAEERATMTISLGGAEGPNLGGMTTMAGRRGPGDRQARTRRVADAPPAREAAEMVEPTAVVEADARRGRVDEAGRHVNVAHADGRRRNQDRSARVNTGGAAIPFGGLAQGGGGAGGVQLDVKNFCCPEYLAQMVQRIRSNWNANQGAGGQPVIKFTIRRDGMLTNVELEKSSGQDAARSRGAARRDQDHAAAAAAARVHRKLADRSPHFRLSALMTYHTLLDLSLPSPAAVAIGARGAAAAGHAAAIAAKRREHGRFATAAIPACRRRSRFRRSSR